MDLISVKWADNTLQGRSRVVAGDRYELAIRVPPGDTLATAMFGDEPALAATEGQLARAAFTPAATGEVEWEGFLSPTESCSMRSTIENSLLREDWSIREEAVWPNRAGSLVSATSC